MNCPRCLSDNTHVCREGREDGRLVWTMYYCSACEFNWRDSEPEATLDPGLRPTAFQLDPARLDAFPVVIPPMKR